MKEKNELEKLKKKGKFKEKIKKFFKNANNKLKLNDQKFSLLELVLLICVAFVFGIFISEAFIYNGNKESALLPTNNSEIQSVYNDILKNYYKDINEKELQESAIKGMLNYLEDNYSVYYDQVETDSFNEKLDGTYLGIGFEVTYGIDKVPTISRVFEDTPASKAKLQKDDRIIKVNGIDVRTNTLDELVSKIKGVKDRKVTLIIERDKKEMTKQLTTTEVSIPSVSSKTFEENGKKIGYINISLFALNTDKQFIEELKKLEEQEKVNSLIIDVRSNLGGHLSSVTNILNQFFGKNDVLYQIEKKGIVKKVYGTDLSTRKYPIVVLIDGASASASEILASAFKEISHSQIIGNTTFGKGTVQQTSELATGGMIKITTETWLTSLGNQINKVGVTPTKEVSLDETYAKNPTDANDKQLQEAIKYLKDK